MRLYEILLLIAQRAKNPFPVGAIYMSVDPTNPSEIFGGTWESWGGGRVPVSVDTTQTEFDTVEETGGAKTHTLTETEMPSHRHFSGLYQVADRFGSGGRDAAGKYVGYGGAVYTSSTGGSGAHNNLQPYITCYMWKRTA